MNPPHVGPIAYQLDLGGSHRRIEVVGQDHTCCKHGVGLSHVEPFARVNKFDRAPFQGRLEGLRYVSSVARRVLFEWLNE